MSLQFHNTGHALTAAAQPIADSLGYRRAYNCGNLETDSSEAGLKQRIAEAGIPDGFTGLVTIDEEGPLMYGMLGEQYPTGTYIGPSPASDKASVAYGKMLTTAKRLLPKATVGGYSIFQHTFFQRGSMLEARFNMHAGMLESLVATSEVLFPAIWMPTPGRDEDERAMNRMHASNVLEVYLDMSRLRNRKVFPFVSNIDWYRGPNGKYQLCPIEGLRDYYIYVRGVTDRVGLAKTIDGFCYFQADDWHYRNGFFVPGLSFNQIEDHQCRFIEMLAEIAA